MQGPPLSWTKVTPYAKLGLHLPAQVAHAPVLRERLYRGETKGLLAFDLKAADPKDGLRGDPPVIRAQGPREMDVAYTFVLETPRLIGLRRDAYEDTHGAHPNDVIGGVVFDKASNTNLHPLDLLKLGVDERPLDKALCDAARAAKRERNTGWKEAEDPNFSCPTWRGIPGPKGRMLEGSSPPQITLTPGDRPGRAAGLTFLYSAYDIGSHAEGPYDIVLPATVFGAALKPEYAAQFAGTPTPVRD